MPNDINFGAIRDSAIASMETSTSQIETPAPTEVATPEVATSEVKPEGSTPAATVVKPRFKLKDPEGEFEVDEDELKNGHLRFRDYTRKTQAVAEAKKMVEAERAALVEREQRINNILSDADNVAKYYEFLTGKPLTPAQAARVEQGLTPNPGNQGANDEVATLADAQRLAEENANKVGQRLEQQMLEKVARTQQWTQEQIHNAQAQVEQARTAATYHSDITATIDALSKEFPLLGQTYDLAELEDTLCREVMKVRPGSIDEAKQLLISAAKERNGRLEKAFETKHQEKVVEKATLTNNGIEPSGGNAPGISAIKHRLGDKALTQSAIAFMEQSTRK